MRAYTVLTTALALDVDPKWLDNLLSHHDVPGVAPARRGVRRRIPPGSVAIIALARALNSTLGVPTKRALEMAIELAGEGSGECTLAPGLTLVLDRERLAADVAHRLDDAAEFAAVPRRGRPPGARRGSGR